MEVLTVNLDAADPAIRVVVVLLPMSATVGVGILEVPAKHLSVVLAVRMGTVDVLAFVLVTLGTLVVVVRHLFVHRHVRTEGFVPSQDSVSVRIPIKGGTVEILSVGLAVGLGLVYVLTSAIATRDTLVVFARHQYVLQFVRMEAPVLVQIHVVVQTECTVV
ncbi:uncharacterized protein LOC134232958 [Saccostrea cucullata]|uniref:uncharacterized protein LOC134232958 n=1 Tax=Saccostrea cuccullata TaxID=36930 RepID=UPI002ED2F4FC